MWSCFSFSTVRTRVGLCSDLLWLWDFTPFLPGDICSLPEKQQKLNENNYISMAKNVLLIKHDLLKKKRSKLDLKKSEERKATACKWTKLCIIKRDEKWNHYNWTTIKWRLLLLNAFTLRKRLRIHSLISVNYHYITVLCPVNLFIRFKCYNTV